MMSDITKQASEYIAKTQDDWFIEILLKHCSLDYSDRDFSDFDINEIKRNHNLELIHEDKKINVYIENELVAYWNTDYEWVNNGEKVIMKIDKWVK